MNRSRLQIVLIAGAVMLAVGLYLAPSQVNSKPGTSSNNTLPYAGFDFKELIKTAKASLKDERKGTISALEMRLSTHPDSISLYDSLGAAWDRANIPAVSAYYF